jgi:superfamily II RNA helicase
MEYRGFVLDKFQEESIRAIDSNHSVVVSAPTGSGKTLIADYIIDQEIKRGSRVVYTAPIKALSNQKYKEFCNYFGEDKIGLLTGDVVKNPRAQIVIMTTEIYRNMVLIDEASVSDVTYVIFDEIHYINDIERGHVWEESIIFSRPEVRFLCLSATIPNAVEFADWIESIKKHKVVVIKHTERPVPLHKAFYDSELGITNLAGIKNAKETVHHSDIWKKKGAKHQIPAPSHVNLIQDIRDKLPCLFFNFSRVSCQRNALELSKKNFFGTDAKIMQVMREKLRETPKEINELKSTQILRETLPKGIGFHHAGLIPIMKDLVEELFSQGLIKVLYTTETFAVGINMPAKSVAFESLRKFDGVSFRFLNSKEFFQIAGRAGRRGIDKEGFVFVMVDRRDFDFGRMRFITSTDTVPLKSQFKLSINTTLNLIKSHSPEETEEILVKSFYYYQKYGGMEKNREGNPIKKTFNSQKARLEKMGYVIGWELTEKGEFSSRIYTKELLIGEIFATPLFEKLDDYQLMLVLAAVVYEARERTEFFKVFDKRPAREIRRLFQSNEFVARDRCFKYLEELTAFVYPCYSGKSIFEIILNTNL